MKRRKIKGFQEHEGIHNNEQDQIFIENGFSEKVPFILQIKSNEACAEQLRSTFQLHQFFQKWMLNHKNSRHVQYFKGKTGFIFYLSGNGIFG